MLGCSFELFLVLLVHEMGNNLWIYMVFPFSELVFPRGRSTALSLTTLVKMNGVNERLCASKVEKISSTSVGRLIRKIRAESRDPYKDLNALPRVGRILR